MSVLKTCKCGKKTSSGRCKSCSNKERKGFKMSEQAKVNISKSKLGLPTWNKNKNHLVDNRIKIKPLEKINAVKYGLRKDDWVKFSKNLRKDIEKCQICGKQFDSNNISEIDHIIPFNISKDNSPNNLQVICRNCHAKKTYYKDNTSLWEKNH
jgi:5-methylcytosine-specific restriction endonuclease McrA